jgi:pyruvate,water dikinase
LFTIRFGLHENHYFPRRKIKTVLPFSGIGSGERLLAGGKGGMLARLFRRGYPIPDGCVIYPAAFESDELRPAAWELVCVQLLRLRRRWKHARFAVRSSVLGEDSALASFAASSCR